MRVATVKELGDAVRAARRRHHMTQQALAERAGVSRYWLGDLERGQANPSWDVVARLATALELDLFVGERHAPTAAAAVALSGEGRLTVGAVDLDAVVEAHREGDGPATSASRAANRSGRSARRERS